MRDAASLDWTQVDLTSRRGAWGQRITAGLLVASGVIGFALSFPSLSAWWWELALLGFGCLLMVLLGIGLWINARVNADETVTLKESGVRVELPVVGAFETTDEAVRYQLQLRLPEPEQGREYLVHACGDRRCIAAGRAAPNAELPVLIDAKTKTWGVIHGVDASETPTPPSG
ncbi:MULTISPECIES: hypothetical protein [unclassified Microbacterium]|uniref:hypothetical protein n=1 Tax=unclassified Microbacterium TaxID=2609290 RepID=UPI0004933480|nr:MULTISPECIES: hypothetical protein [unclassified Microbacterium]MCV0336397.1 hypothetical protein [Microbacterium sp.]MCV0376665.1 hypothetical protein [Microbacterium sp.]MCV0391414.1 hypothetical protein [Microbacterium sp.]MCV0420020.1 hypothetical protein [Microbacterium sp.]MCV0423809.1 hypothetical protein [Microbacterium sp.]